MGLKDLYPSKEDWKNLFDLDYWRGRSIWWYGEQLLSLAFVVLALVHAHAIADYKQTIQHEVKEKGCYELFRGGVQADLYNDSELPNQLNETNYEDLIGSGDEKKSKLPDGEMKQYFENQSGRK